MPIAVFRRLLNIKLQKTARIKTGRRTEIQILMSSAASGNIHIFLKILFADDLTTVSHRVYDHKLSKIVLQVSNVQQECFTGVFKRMSNKSVLQFQTRFLHAITAEDMHCPCTKE